MNIDEIKELINAVSDSELSALDYHEGNVNISLRKGNAPAAVQMTVADTTSVTHSEMAPSNSEAPKAEASSPDAPKEVQGKVVKSPLVGTVYLSAEEGGEPLVSVGDTVKKGQTLAIVEAMKLMNEIGSEFDGVVKEVLVENGQTVEYDQGLFVIG